MFVDGIEGDSLVFTKMAKMWRVNGIEGVMVLPVKVFTTICMPPSKHTMAKTEDKVEVDVC